MMSIDKSNISPLLALPFRIFFLLTALAGVILPTFWISIYLGATQYHGLLLAPLHWHIHEMIFGFTGALISGFILTASANWSGRPAFRGTPLLVLALLWVVERLALYIPIPPVVALLLSLPFFGMLTVMLYLQLRFSPRQLKTFVPIISVLFLAKILFLVGSYLNKIQLMLDAKDFALGMIKFLILLIAGRVVPFFTNSKMGAHLHISVPPFIQIAALVPVFLLALPIPFLQQFYVHTSLLSAAIILLIVRSYYWHPLKSAKEPMLLILNMGVLWMVIHFILDLVSGFNPAYAQFQAPLHAFAAGSVGVTALGMMTRVSLGHTGRKIEADYGVWIIFICVNLGAVSRVFLPYFISNYPVALSIANFFWSFAFLGYFLRFFKFSSLINL
jgi:uncharacterized protein involved in response to NO